MSLALRPAASAPGGVSPRIVLILPTLALSCALVLGAVEGGYRSTMTAVMDGTLDEAVRMAEVDHQPTSAIESRVRGLLIGFASDATVRTNVREPNGERFAERIISDSAPFGRYNPGDCYLDANGNGRYDFNSGRMGPPEDLLDFEVTMTYRRIVPLGRLLGWNDDVTITRHTYLHNRNGNQTIRCT